jgi:hypothetical protein
MLLSKAEVRPIQLTFERAGTPCPMAYPEKNKNRQQTLLNPHFVKDLEYRFIQASSCDSMFYGPFFVKTQLPQGSFKIG